MDSCFNRLASARSPVSAVNNSALGSNTSGPFYYARLWSRVLSCCQLQRITPHCDCKVAPACIISCVSVLPSIRLHSALHCICSCTPHFVTATTLPLLNGPCTSYTKYLTNDSLNAENASCSIRNDLHYCLASSRVLAAVGFSTLVAAEQYS